LKGENVKSDGEYPFLAKIFRGFVIPMMVGYDFLLI